MQKEHGELVEWSTSKDQPILPVSAEWLAKRNREVDEVERKINQQISEYINVLKLKDLRKTAVHKLVIEMYAVTKNLLMEDIDRKYSWTEYLKEKENLRRISKVQINSLSPEKL